jgi:hypothetical protein
MIVAGVDEAGYGPLLGPLVVGCCAFDIGDAGDSDNLPCLWKRLSRLVGKKRSASGRKLHINDSKLVYSPAIGLKELERSVLAVLAAATEAPVDLTDLFMRTAGHVVPELADYPWYGPCPDERFPLEQESVSIQGMANALRQEMARSGTLCMHLSARVVLERQLNAQIKATRNKSNVLFSVTAIHLDEMLRRHGHGPLTIVCDQHGGREYYASHLRLMFDQWSLEILSEGDGLAEYNLHRNGNTVRLIFREKAEMSCLAVALASMLSKYLRETLMRRFNAFWAQQCPKVAPTAGYYGDGARFLRDIAPKRRELGILDEQLIRAR